MQDGRMLLVHRTRLSGLRVAAMIDHEVVEAPEGRELRSGSRTTWPEPASSPAARPGARWPSSSSSPTGGRRVAPAGPRGPGGRGAVPGPRTRGSMGWSTGQRRYLDDFWDRADVEVEGDPEVQQAVRFALWQVLQAGARDREAGHRRPRGSPAPATTATPSGTPRCYVLPVLTYTQPRGRRRRPVLAPRRPAGRDRAGPPAGARGRRLPVADHPRRGELGILAGEHGCLPHQCGRRRRGAALLSGHRRRGVRSSRPGSTFW